MASIDILGRNTKRALHDLQGAFTAYRKQVAGQIAEMASKITIATDDNESGLYSGNRYKTYESQIKALSDKYTAISSWGVLQTGNIVDVRAAFIVGSGLKLRAKDETFEAKRALEFADALFTFNDFQREMLQELSKEGELEGKLLLKLFSVTPENEVRGDQGTVFKAMVSIRHIPWSTNRYVIATQPDDYMRYLKATWKPSGGGADEVLEAKDFVFKRFGGRVSNPNVTPPKLAKCLTQIEDLDKALRDWREINRLFAGPKLHVQCDSPESALAMQEQLGRLNWKIKEAIAHTGVMGYASPTMEGVASIEREIITLAKMISGTTGVPVHFLGLPDLMSNRSTADNLFELVFAATQKEREAWKGLLAELVDKAIAKYNETSQMTPIKPGLVDVDIPFISREQWDHIEKVWIPLYQAGALTLKALLSKVPDVDAEAIVAEKETQKVDEFERIKKELADMEAEADAKKAQPGNQKPPFAAQEK